MHSDHVPSMGQLHRWDGSETASPVSSIGQSADQEGIDNLEIGEVVSLIGQSASQEIIVNDNSTGENSSSEFATSDEQQQEEEEISSSSSHLSSNCDDGEDRARSGSGATHLSSVSVCEREEGRFRLRSGATLCGELLYGTDGMEDGTVT